MTTPTTLEPPTRNKLCKVDRRLLGAVERGNVELASAALQAGANPFSQAPWNHQTALQIASRHGDIPILECLYKSGSVPPVECLHWVCASPPLKHSNGVELVEQILDNHHNILNLYHERYNHRTPLFAASEAGNLWLATYLVENTSCRAYDKDRDGLTALSIAVQNGHLRVVRFLRFLVEDHDAASILPALCVVRETNGGRSPLHDACERGHMSTVLYLLQWYRQCGDKPQLSKLARHLVAAKDSLHNETPLLIAARKIRFDILEWLCEKETQELMNDKVELEELVVNSSNDKGETVFHFAASFGNDVTLKRILEMETRIRGGDNENDSQSLLVHQPAARNGWTPLHYAARFGKTSAAKYLLEVGAKETGTEVDPNDTLFRLAAAHNHFSVCDLFLESAAKHGNVVVYPNATNASGTSVLHHACRGLGLRRLKQLLGDGTTNIPFGEQANLELLEPKSEKTPLLVASADGNFTFFSYLLSKNARVDVAERGGFTPLHHLCLFGRLDLVQQVLESPDYSPSQLLAAADKDGWTPLVVAAIYKRADVVQYLIEGILVANRF